MDFELSDMLKSSCELKQPSVNILIGVYNATNGHPCEGCALKKDCGARHNLELSKQHHRRFQPSVRTETNADTAKRLGISKRQVSKMRKLGKI